MRNWVTCPLGALEEKILFESNVENQWFCCRTTLVFKLQMWRNSYHGVGGGFFHMHLGWEACLYYGIFLGGWISECILDEKSCVTGTEELLQAVVIANVIAGMGNCFTWSSDCKLSTYSWDGNFFCVCSIYSTAVTLRLSLVSNQRIIFAILATTNIYDIKRIWLITRYHRIRSFMHLHTN